MLRITTARRALLGGLAFAATADAAWADDAARSEEHTSELQSQ